MARSALDLFNRDQVGQSFPAFSLGFGGVVVDAVGLEPTTLRLTARHLPDSALLSIALYRTIPVVYRHRSLPDKCGYRPQLLAILNQSTHKSPHSISDTVSTYRRTDAMIQGRVKRETAWRPICYFMQPEFLALGSTKKVIVAGSSLTSPIPNDSPLKSGTVPSALAFSSLPFNRTDLLSSCGADRV